MKQTGILGASLIVGLVGFGAAADAASLVPHRAVYDLNLRETRKPNAVERVRGRMVYEFTGNACEGYVSKARQVTEMVDPEGDKTTSDLQSSSTEAGQGKSYRFESKTFTDQNLSKEIIGHAERKPDGQIAVTITKPAEAATLPASVIFPTQHTYAILQGAEGGRATVEAEVFDGASDSSKIYSTLAVIGQRVAPGDAGADIEQASKAEPLLKAARWPVRVSYFDGSGKSGEGTPLYTMGFELYDNGVSRALLIDYGDFVLDGTLREIEFLPEKPCTTPP